MSTATMDRPTTERPRITDPSTQVWSTSVRDQLRILVALGYDWGTLIDLVPGAMLDLALAYQRCIITRAAAEQVQGVFEDLTRDVVPPFGAAAEQALDYAVTAGWGVVDIVAVRRALAVCQHLDQTMWRDPPPPLTPLERKTAVYLGARRGYSETALIRASGLSADAIGLMMGRDPIDTRNGSQL